MQKKLYLCSGFMDKKHLYHIVEWTVALAACVWLVWKLATYDDYAGLWDCLQSMGWRQWIAILVCIALMPLNMSLEAWRWRTLMSDLSWREATRQVYYSKLAGLITPWRLGEYPARAVLMSQSPITNHQSPITNYQSPITNRDLWSLVLSMGAVGSATMTMAIVIAGVAGIAFSPSVLPYLGDSYLYALLAVVIVLGIVFALAPRVLQRWAQVNHDLMLRSIGQSLVRLACWCVQLALVLYALGAITNYQSAITNYQSAITNLPVYYLLVTITPNVPIAEAGVRGVWAMVLFGTMNAALAGVLLWVINTLLPCQIWPFLRKKT